MSLVCDIHEHIKNNKNILILRDPIVSKISITNVHEYAQDVTFFIAPNGSTIFDDEDLADFVERQLPPQYEISGILPDFGYNDVPSARYTEPIMTIVPDKSKYAVRLIDKDIKKDAISMQSRPTCPITASRLIRIYIYPNEYVGKLFGSIEKPELSIPIDQVSRPRWLELFSGYFR